MPPVGVTDSRTADQGDDHAGHSQGGDEQDGLSAIEETDSTEGEGSNAEGDSVDTRRHLLNIVMDPLQHKKDNEIAFDVAVMRNSTQILSILLEKAIESDMDRGIINAIKAGNMVMLKTLLE